MIPHLRRVIKRFVDDRGQTPQKMPSGVPLVTARNIKNRRIDFSVSEEFMAEELYDQWMVRGLPERGDVLLTTEAPLGESAQIEDPGVALAQRLILLKADKAKITNDYLKYHFAADSGRAELWSKATGSTAFAAFLNTEGGDLLIGVTDDHTVVGIDHDRLDNDDKFMRHLVQVVHNGLGDRAGTCVDPGMQIVQGKTVCVVSCQRSPEPVFLKWKGTQQNPDGDFYVRSGPRTDRLAPASATQYIKTRFLRAPERK